MLGRFEVVNVVATTHVGVELDLDLLSVALSDMGSVSYDRSRFPGLVLKVGRVAYLVFRTGRVVVVGCRSTDEVQEAVRRLLRRIQLHVPGVPSRVHVQIQNMVLTIDLGRRVDLERLSTKLERSIYIPDDFPGLIYKSGIGKPAALVFSSGRIVVVGATSVEDAEEVVREITSAAEEGEG